LLAPANLQEKDPPERQPEILKKGRELPGVFGEALPSFSKRWRMEKSD
jgi:hypothetical protein